MLKKRNDFKPEYIVEFVSNDIIKCLYYDNRERYTYFERSDAPSKLKKGDVLAEGKFEKLIHVHKRLSK